MSEYRLTPLSAAQAKGISRWTYGPGLGLYHFTEADLPAMLAARYRYHAVCDGDALVGVACFGEAARVQGGPYPPGALDIGCSLAPGQVGAGRGRGFVAAVVAFAGTAFAAVPLRLSVAEANPRAIRVFEANGFVPVTRFAGLARGGTHRFLLMMRR